ncbi:DUF3098 domain-containing protein [candidate division WOR-3 bacterium]|nr:DUF3098 domain-containing protein [candidate division WOR-3 bacterium]
MKPDRRPQKTPPREQKTAKPATPKKVRPQVALAPGNYILMAVALLTIAVGFIILARGSITAAPILLVLGYCVLVPLSLMLTFRRPPARPAAGPTDGVATAAAPARPGAEAGEK